MDSGVKVVGAPSADDARHGGRAESDDGHKSGDRHAAHPRQHERKPEPPVRLVVVAIVGLVGTLVFGLLYATKSVGVSRTRRS